MKTNGSDLAYPNEQRLVENKTYTTGGLTKREYFAALAMQGCVSGSVGVEALVSVHPSNWSEVAVQCADALIAELNKETP